MDFGIQSAFRQLVQRLELALGTMLRVTRATRSTELTRIRQAMEPAGSLPTLHWGCYEPYPTDTNDVSHELPPDLVRHAGRSRKWQAAAGDGR